MQVSHAKERDYWKNENGLRGMKGNYKAMTKQSSKVHFTVQTRTFLSDNVSGDSSVIHVSASLILKTANTFLVAEAVS